MDIKHCKCLVCGEDNPNNFYSSNKSKCKACLIAYTIHLKEVDPEYRERQLLSTRKAQEKRRRNPIYRRRHALYYKHWYATGGRKRNPTYRAAASLWEVNHPDAVVARRKVAKAINAGLLEKPLECNICGGGGRINGHHDDYNQPYDVIWLCSSCHKKLHLLNQGYKCMSLVDRGAVQLIT